MAGYLTRDRLAVLAALAAPLGLAAVLVPFRGGFPNTDAALAMLLAVVAVAANGYRLAGVLAALSAAVRRRPGGGGRGLAVGADGPGHRPAHRSAVAAVLRFQYGIAGVGRPARLQHDGSVTTASQAWDADAYGLPPGRDLELLAESGGVFQGRFLMTPLPGARPTHEQRLLAVAFASQVGAALATSHPVDQG